MAFFRVLLLVLLLSAGGLFGVYAFTGQGSYRKWGLRLLVTTLAAGLVFFAVLIADRLGQ